MPTARYDGHTAWYDAFASGELFESLRRDAVTLLGDGPGRCLDLGCGTGRSAPHLRAVGWSVVGVDVSADQLEAAAELCDDVRLADAHALPFEDASFDAVISLLTHTDFDDAA